MKRPLTSMLFVVGAAVALAAQPGQTSAAAAFDRFFSADSEAAASEAAAAVVAAGASFDEVLQRLKQGPRYSADVPRGVLQQHHRIDDTEFYFALDVPADYTPERRYPVRFQLHGGVGRLETSAPPAVSMRLAGADAITVIPAAWRDAPWWSRRQIANLTAILETLKRTYNVDENRVVVMGVSDGGTAAYFTAMRSTTPFASFIALNGFIMVLKNEQSSDDGDVFPQNLTNKPLFIVNGGRDPLYPTSVVDPFIDHMKQNGVELTYRPQPLAGHDTSWWPTMKDEVDAFVAAHPRQPLPDRVTWESGETPARAHWLVINRLSADAGSSVDMPDLNRRATKPMLDFGVRSSGRRINRLAHGSNAAQLGLRAGDVVMAINSLPTPVGVDLAEVFGAFPAGRPVVLSIERAGTPVRITGRYAPTLAADDGRLMFPADGPSGRVDLVRKGNRVEASTRGVGSFTLLLSPDQFDLTRPITIVVNGRAGAEQVVKSDTATLLRWAARDHDRTMLFGAEVTVEVP